MKKSNRGNGDRSFQSNGKGDKSRISNVKTFRENWDNIDWNRPPDVEIREAATITTSTASEGEPPSAGAFAIWQGPYGWVNRPK